LRRRAIDLHYGHLAVDSHEHAVFLLDALAIERAVEAGWTPPRQPANATVTRLQSLAEHVRGGWWTLGGHRRLKPLPPLRTESAD
jgi:hypothetical protein